MFKLLEKRPFARWKFVQRMVHRHRMNKTTGTNRYKTFSKANSSNPDTLLDNSSIDEADFTQTNETNKKSPFYNRRKLDKANENELDASREAEAKRKSPFHSRRKLDKANAEMGLLAHVELEASPKLLRRTQSNNSISTGSNEEDKIDTTLVVGAAATANTVIADVNNSEKISADSHADDASCNLSTVDSTDFKNSHNLLQKSSSGDNSAVVMDSNESTNANNVTVTAATNLDAKVYASPLTEAEIPIENLSSQTSASKPQYTPLSFSRNNKVRNSFKEFKRRSISQLDSARESMRRRANARKYDNLDGDAKTKNEEELVSYDRSPGSKRRQQVIEI